MSDSAETLRLQIAQTSSRLAASVATLEQKLSATIGSSGDSVASAAETLKSTAKSVASVIESVGEACDLQHGFEKRPWMVVGGVALAGFLAGELANTALRGAGACVAPKAKSPPIAAGVAPLRASDSSGGVWRRVEALLLSAARLVASRAAPQIIDRMLSSNQRSDTKLTTQGNEP